MGLREHIIFRNWPRPLEEFGVPDLTLDLSVGSVGSFRLESSVEILKQRLDAPGSWKRWHALDGSLSPPGCLVWRR